MTGPVESVLFQALAQFDLEVIQVAEAAHGSGEFVGRLRRDLATEVHERKVEMQLRAAKRLDPEVVRDGQIELPLLAALKADDLVVEAREEAVLAQE